MEMNNEAFEEIYRDNNLIVYRNKMAYPYFYAAHRFIIETDEDKIFNLVKSGRYDLTKIPVIEEEPPDFIKNYEFDDDSTGYQIQNLTDDDLWKNTSDDFKVQVIAAEPGFLVISDNYHSGWEAYIDGEKTKIFRANYVWKGVFFKPGNHIIEFKFHSDSIDISNKISGFSILLFIILLGFIEIKEKNFLKK